MTASTSPRSFASPAAFRAWLSRHHARERELVVRCYKVRAGDRGMTHPQAVDEALCFGWIDGIRRSLDGVSFTVRFTPRKPRSIWSRVNLARVKALAAEGRMAPSGRAAFEARDPRRTGIYSFERAALKLTPAFARRLRADAAAWAFFQSQPPWYRRVSTFWVMSAVKEATRLRRLATLIAYSAGGRSIRPLDRTKAGK